MSCFAISSKVPHEVLEILAGFKPGCRRSKPWERSPGIVEHQSAFSQPFMLWIHYITHRLKFRRDSWFTWHVVTVKVNARAKLTLFTIFMDPPWLLLITWIIQHRINILPTPSEVVLITIVNNLVHQVKTKELYLGLEGHTVKTSSKWFFFFLAAEYDYLQRVLRIRTDLVGDTGN